jgi:hypothetical protein
MLPETVRRQGPLLLALLLVGAILGGLLVGYEPVGGDPDRMYRPLKSELARALGENRLPFWSERFGLGVPLVAESHVAAFYPPNLLLYRVLDVATAYRLAMWLHYLALVATTYFYARCLGIGPWGAAMSGVAFTLCGFQAIHSSHEPFYCVLPYLPLALGIAERFLATGSLIWLSALPLVLGLQWTLGHFQIQTWTGGLVIVTALWRAVFEQRSWRRAFAVILAVVWGMAFAAVQLGPSWQFARLVGQTERPVNERLFYSLPPTHWFELALPRLVRELRLGSEDPYWYGQQTTGYEAVLYAGTIPLIFALIGGLARPVNRATLPCRLLVPISFAIATMPRWWPQGYLYLLSVPGLGYFRVPARYAMLTSLGLAVLAGEGFDRSISTVRFRLGLAMALLFGVCATASAVFWTLRLDVHLRSTFGGVADGFLWAALAWSIAVAVVVAWRSERLGHWAPLMAAAIELGILYYAGTTQWGWSIAIPAQSPALSDLASQPSVGLVGGELEDLPVRAGLRTGYPYLGFSLPKPGDRLKLLQETMVQSDSAAIVEASGAEVLKRWLRRFRVTHLVGHHRSWLELGTELGRYRDPALDLIVYHTPVQPATRLWSIVELDQAFPEARVALRSRTIADRRTLNFRLSQSDDLDIAWFLAEDRVPNRPDARSARVVDWDGSTATVEHDGPCDLILARSFDPGWLARIDNGPDQAMLPVDGGFQAVRLDGSGTRRVALRYRTPQLGLWVSITIIAALLDLVLWAKANFRSDGSSRVASGKRRVAREGRSSS